MKTILLVATILLMSCTSENEQNCDAELDRLEQLQKEGWKNCNGSSVCIQKMNKDYTKAREEALKNCR